MFLDIVAPWIIEAWAEFAQALVFDIPTLGINPYQGHALLAVIALVLMAVVWGAVSHLPPHSRIPVRALMVPVMLFPAFVFAGSHTAELRAFHARLQSPPHSSAAERAKPTEGINPVATGTSPGPGAEGPTVRAAASSNVRTSL